jgi:hypothetical protein
MPLNTSRNAAPKQGAMIVKFSRFDDTELNARRRSLKIAGFDPLPANGKAVYLEQWSTKVDIEMSEILEWEKSRPNDTNTGINARRTPALDVDIHDAKVAYAVEEHIRERFADRGLILRRTGAPPKFLVPFRTDVPFAKFIAKVIAPDGTTEKLEFLCDGQQYLAFGVHPSGKRYRWHAPPQVVVEDEPEPPWEPDECWQPGAVKRHQLPAITEAEAQELVEDIAELLIRKHGYQRDDGKKKTADKKNGERARELHRDDWRYHQRWRLSRLRSRSQRVADHQRHTPWRGERHIESDDDGVESAA